MQRDEIKKCIYKEWEANYTHKKINKKDNFIFYQGEERERGRKEKSLLESYCWSIIDTCHTANKILIMSF